MKKRMLLLTLAIAAVPLGAQEAAVIRSGVVRVTGRGGQVTIGRFVGMTADSVIIEQRKRIDDLPLSEDRVQLRMTRSSVRK